MSKLLACIAVAFTLTPGTLWADCVDGSRPATTEEQEFGRKLSASLKAAMPAAPAPLYLESEPEVVLSGVCKDTPVGQAGALATANYTASPDYSDRVKLTIRANYAYPGKDDLVLGTLPKKPAAFKVQNLVVAVDGYKPQYIEAVKQAVDRARLQALIDQPLPATPPPAAWHVGKADATTGAAAPAPVAAQAADAAPAPAAAAPANTAAPQPEPDPTPPDVTKKTKDAVNKLRGLLGH
jgi:hypothetical protein